MKNILLIIFSFISISAFGQFRLDGTGSWSTINDSTYTASITFASDLTGQGYLATQIDSAFQVFTPTEGMYRIDSVWNKTFSSANLRVIEMLGTNGSPFGQIEVFNPDGKLTVPDVPFGSTGATAQLNAAVVTWNARNGGTSIDSTSTSNDSQFVWAGGVGYFSGLADAPRPNNGRVWYVSKSNPSCSAGAVVGDPTRPFCNPWQVRDSLRTGDNVIVNAGRYTFGNIGSGAIIEISSDTDSLNLWTDSADSVVWNYLPGAVIAYIEGDTFDLPISLYKVNDGATTGNRHFEVRGNGQFNLCRKRQETYGRLFDLRNNTDTVNCIIEADYVRGRWHELFGAFTFRRIDIKEFEASSPITGNARFFSWGNSSGIDLSQGIIQINMGKVLIDSGAVAHQDLLLFSQYRTDNKSITVNLKDVFVHHKGWSVMMSEGSGVKNNNSYSFNIDNLICTDPFLERGDYSEYLIDENFKTTPGAGSPLPIDTSATNGSLFSMYSSGDGKNIVDINIKNIKSNHSLFGHMSSTNYKVNASISNWMSSANNPVSVIGTPDNNWVARINLNVKRAEGIGSLILAYDGTGSHVDISGEYIVTTDDTPVIKYQSNYIDGISLENAKLVTNNQTPPIAPITGGNIGTFLIKNTVSNSLLTSPDVTYKISDIIRSTDVR